MITNHPIVLSYAYSCICANSVEFHECDESENVSSKRVFVI